MKHFYSNLHNGNDQFWSRLKSKTQFLNKIMTKLTIVILLALFQAPTLQAADTTIDFGGAVTSGTLASGTFTINGFQFVVTCASGFTVSQSGSSLLIDENAADGVGDFEVEISRVGAAFTPGAFTPVSANLIQRSTLGTPTFGATLQQGYYGGASSRTWSGLSTGVNDYTWVEGRVYSTSIKIYDTEYSENSVVGHVKAGITINNLVVDLANPPNTAPTDIGLSNNVIMQSAGVNAVVGNLSATDADLANVHTYSLVSGTGSTDNSNFNIDGTTLRANNTATMAEGTYSVRVRTTDQNTATYEKVFSITVTAYPPVTINNPNANEYQYITNVTLGSINNTSTKTGTNQLAYEDYTAQSTDLALSSTTQISVSLGGSDLSDGSISVFVDWNQNKDFADANEVFVVLAHPSSNLATSAGPFTANIVVPAGATVGQTRMRVVSDYDRTPLISGNIDYGEAEDYTINVVAGSSSAPTVTTQAVSAITTTTATGNGNVTATGGANVTERGIYYSTTNGFADGAGTKVSTTGDWSATGAFTQAITGLTPNTTYYVKAFATNSEGTSYGSVETFTTAPSLYWPNYEANKIEGIYISGTGRANVISAISEPIGIEVDVENQKIYWFSQTDSKIYRANMDGSGSEVFISDPGYASTLFLDIQNGYLYWPNYEATKIERIKIDGTGREDIVTAPEPIGITVDISNSKVYWFDQSDSKLHRANLDGSVSEIFISDPGYASTLYFDQTNSELYWPNYEATKIERINSDGTGREDIVTGTDIISITVDISNSKVYWFDQSDSKLHRANLDGSVSEVFISDPGYASTLIIPYELPSNTAPTVTSQAVSAVSTTTATGNGNITDLGVPNPTAHGVCWNTTGTPTISDGVVDNGAASATGAFTASMSSLTAGTLYYVRTYATNSAGTSYGSQVSFTTENPTIAFNAVSSNGSEAFGSADLQVDLSAVSGREITVDYTVTGTASGSGTDYSLADGTLTIGAGDVNKNITIASIVNDLLDENNETVILTLSNPSNAILGTNTVHTYTINDNDATPTIAFNSVSSNGSEAFDSANLQVDLSAASGLPVSVNYTVTGTASGSGTDYNLADGTLTIGAGNLNKDITIASIVNDLLDENNETVIVSLSSPTNATLGTNTVHTYTINDNDETPLISSGQSFTVNENSLNSTSVGNIFATDTDAGTVFSSWTITAGNTNSVFAINSSTGEVTVNDANALDYELTTNYNLAVTVSDGVNTSATEIVVVNVNNLNDNNPVVTGLQSFTIAENIANASAVGTALASDADAGTSFSSWTETGGTGASIFEINSSTGAITVTDNSSINYEATTSYTYMLTVSDGTNTSAVETITINIADVNDVNPVITALQTFNIDENSVNTTSIGTVLATDGDVTATTFSSWTITAGNTNSVFTINALTGEISVNDATELDFEQTTNYNLSVTVSDGLNTSIVEDLVISLNDVNEVPSAIQLSNVTIKENTAIGTEIGILTASDVDASQTFTYTIADLVNFEIVGDKLVSKTAFDFETQNTYVAEITVIDQGGLAHKQSFSIQISDVNETPTAISLSNATITENSAIGSEVGILTATDQDVAQTFTFTIAENEFFELAGDKLVSKLEFDYEDNNSYPIEITVADQADLTYSESFTIQIEDANEAPIAILLSNATIAENSAIGTEVGILTATDPDINQTFTFSISENKYFEIDGDRIVSKEIFNFEDHITYSVKVIVTDQGGLSYDDRFTLQTKDVNELPEFLSDPLLVALSGENYTYNIEYQDDDESGCNVTAFEIPSWLNLDDHGDGTATLSGIPTEAGTFNVILEASDSENTTRQEFEIVVETVTGIEDVFTAPIVQIYPNPVARELHIDLSDFRNDETTISLFSTSGSLIFKEEHQNIGGKVKIIKTVQQLQSGVYLLLIESEGYRKSYKIVKQ